MDPRTDLGVLLMAYGTPQTLDDVPRYYTDIRHGRPPPAELLDELMERYRAIGGRSPLAEITEAQARGIEKRLEGARAYVGFKHASPFVGDAVAAMAAEGVTHAVGLVMAPHYSTMSIGDYERRARRVAAEVGWSGKLEVVQSWHLEPGFLALLAERVQRAIDSIPFAARADAVVYFTAHSLPEQIVASNDPYPEQLKETGRAVADRLSLERWDIGWQSASRTDTPWLGPDLNDLIQMEAGRGTPAIVVCPCGFVADHLEILYDIDIEAQERARDLGVHLVRTDSMNDDPDFLDVLAGIVRRAASPIAARRG